MSMSSEDVINKIVDGLSFETQNPWWKKELRKLIGLYLNIAICLKLLDGRINLARRSFASVMVPMSMRSLP